MAIAERHIGSVTIVDLSGKLTSSDQSGKLKEKVDALLAQDRKQIVLNLGEVTYVDSAGLGEIVSCYSTARRQSATVSLANLHKRVQELLVITKLHAVFDVYESEKAAIDSFAPATT